MSEEKKPIEKVKVSKEQAQKIYSTGGLIIVGYTFRSSTCEDLKKEARFKFIDCGLTWEAIQSIYRVGGVQNITYYTDKESEEASAMCDLMCGEPDEVN